MRLRHGAAFAGAASSLALIACLSPTVIVLRISTDVPCSQLGQVEIYAGEDATSPVALAETCADGDVGSLVLTPSGAAPGGPIEVRASTTGVAGCAPPYSSCIIARRRLTFVPHRTLTIPIRLGARCVGVVCDASTTCSDETGACVSATVDCVGTYCALGDAGR